jgi:heme-degrading monooxygenase HmoA
MLYIFEIEITDPDYTAEQYADAWERASRYIQAAPGARGPRLHRRISDPRRLLAIATWESKAARDAMEQDPPQVVRDIIQSQIPYVSINVVGEFEGPEWEVLPPQEES